MHASHALRSFLTASQHQKRSTAILYLDVKSAYYRVIRQLASNLTYSDEDIAKVMQHFDLEPEEMHHLMEEIQQRSALRQAGGGVQDELLLEELLQNTWFTTSSQRHITESTAGTRPGDGLADVVFSFVFQRILAKVHHELQDILQGNAAGQQVEVDITTPPNCEMELAPMVEVVWADDLAFGIHADTASAVISQITVVARHLFQKCLQHGMRPNMARNKTEAMLYLQGPGSRQIKKELYNRDAPSLHIEEVPQEYSDLKLTGSYKHLGHRLQLGDSIMGEIKARTGQASSVFRKYRRQVFQNPRLPLSKRKYLFQSLVLSILRYNMGTWPRLTGKCWLYFQSRVMSLYRGLVRTTIKEPVLRFWNNDRILSYLELPSPADLLHDSRLRYSLSLLKHGPQQLWCLLVAEKEWLGLLRESLDWMQEQLAGYGPDRHGHPFAPNWNNWFREQPQVAKGWISKALRHSTIQRCIRTQWFEWHHVFLTECKTAGMQIEFPWTNTENNLLEKKTKIEACLMCQQLFKGKAPWSVHAFKKHDRINWRRKYISNGRCEVCMKDYHTPSRLLNHLNYSGHCADVLRRHRIRAEVQPGRNNRAEVRDGPMKIPVLHSEGPVQDWEHVDPYPDDPNLDYAFIDTLVDCFEAIQDTTNIDDAILDFKRTFLASSNAFSTLCYTFGCMVRDLLPEAECPRTTKQRRIVLMVQDLLRLRWFFSEQEIEQMGQMPSAEDLRGNAWKYCSEDRSRKCWSVNGYDPRNQFSDFAIVHLFAGERREGDLEAFLEGITIPVGAIRVIISVDIIYDSRNADLSQESVQERWYGFILKGLIAVLYTGPPCETWSSSRALGGVAGFSTGDDGPRMLRTSEWTYGLPSLKLREAKQVLMANILLTFSILAFLLMLRVQRVAVLEHPFKPQERWMPSIWRLHVIDLLTGHERVRQHHIQQGRFGGHSPKPTTLLVTAPDQEAITNILMRHAITPLPKAVQMGKVDGEYGTAKLKNYPPLLCQALAQMAQEWAFANFEVPVIPKSDNDFLTYIARLRCGFNQSAQRGQDYAHN